MSYSVHEEVERVIHEVDQRQEQGRKQNNVKLEGVEQINDEAKAISKTLAGHLNDRTNLLTEIEKEHAQYVGQVATNNEYKYNVRQQIHDIHYLIKLLNFEIS